MEELGVFDIIAQVGAPIAAALFMGGFIFLIIRKIMDDVVAVSYTHLTLPTILLV